MDISHSFALNSDRKEEEKGRVALKAFFNITDEWGCSNEERRALMGGVSRSTLHKYSKFPALRLARDVLERISYVMGIYKALQLLYPTPELANQRVRRPTTDLPFAGVSAMDFMVRGSILHLAETRRYFDAQRGW